MEVFNWYIICDLNVTLLPYNNFRLHHHHLYKPNNFTFTYYLKLTIFVSKVTKYYFSRELVKDFYNKTPTNFFFIIASFFVLITNAVTWHFKIKMEMAYLYKTLHPKISATINETLY